MAVDQINSKCQIYVWIFHHYSKYNTINMQIIISDHKLMMKEYSFIKKAVTVVTGLQLKLSSFEKWMAIVIWLLTVIRSIYIYIYIYIYNSSILPVYFFNTNVVHRILYSKNCYNFFLYSTLCIQCLLRIVIVAISDLIALLTSISWVL